MKNNNKKNFTLVVDDELIQDLYYTSTINKHFLSSFKDYRRTGTFFHKKRSDLEKEMHQIELENLLKFCVKTLEKTENVINLSEDSKNFRKSDFPVIKMDSNKILKWIEENGSEF